MGQIFTVSENQSEEYIKFDITEEGFDFLKAKQLAKETAENIGYRPEIIWG